MSSSLWFSDFETLLDVEREIWEHLSESPSERASGWRLPVLATQSRAVVRQRIVVLRGVDIEHRSLLAHTDQRSPKINALNDHPETSWLFYDTAQKVQLQLNGTATVHLDDDIADRMWKEETEASLRSYLAPLPPGTTTRSVNVNLPERFRQSVPGRHDLQHGRENFAVISCQIHTAELLALRQNGNIRAKFAYSDDTIEKTWLAP